MLKSTKMVISRPSPVEERTFIEHNELLSFRKWVDIYSYHLLYCFSFLRNDSVFLPLSSEWCCTAFQYLAQLVSTSWCWCVARCDPLPFVCLKPRAGCLPSTYQLSTPDHFQHSGLRGLLEPLPAVVGCRQGDNQDKLPVFITLPNSQLHANTNEQLPIRFEDNPH